MLHRSAMQVWWVPIATPRVALPISVVRLMGATLAIGLWSWSVRASLSLSNRRTLSISVTTCRVLPRTCVVKAGMLVGPVTLALTSLVQLETSASGAPSLRSMPVANLWCTALPLLCSPWLARTACVSGTSLLQGMLVLTALRRLVRRPTGRITWCASY